MAVLAKRKSNPEGRMSLVDHLLEFRNRVVKSAIALFLGAIIGWVLFDFVYEHLTAPLVAVAKSRGQEGQLVTLNYGGLTAPFCQRINLSIWVGVIVASLVWLYQAWAYIVPALTPKERKLSYAFIGSTIPLFAAGCAFGFWTLPKAVKILLGFTPNGAANLPDAALYFQTVTRFILVFGLTWILPVVLVGLIAVRIVPGRSLMRQWRPAIIGVFVVSAVVTPTPDPLTMFLMAAPLMVLYFLAALIGIRIDKRRDASAPSWTSVSDDQASAL